MDYLLLTHPVALFSMVDSYERKITTTHSIGVLLGSVKNVNGTKTIETRNAYPIKYKKKENDLQLNVRWDQAESWAELHKLTYPDESIVGWFLVGKMIPIYAPLLHEYCQQRYTSHTCVMLFVDLSFQTDNIELKAYRMSVLAGSTPQERTNQFGHVFIPFPHRVKISSPENIIMSLMARLEQAPKRPPTDDPDLAKLESLSHSVRSPQDIVKMLEQIIDYVGAIINQKIENPNPDFGRDLIRLLSSVPVSGGQEYTEQISGLVQDLLMVLNLSEVAQLQVGMSESISNLDPLNY